MGIAEFFAHYRQIARIEVKKANQTDHEQKIRDIEQDGVDIAGRNALKSL